MSGTKTQVISAKRIGLIIVITVITAAVLAGIALVVYFTWPKDTSPEATLIGNFTILQKTLSEVSDGSICSYLTEILSASQLSTISCSILDKRSGSVKVRYRLIIKDSNVKDELKLLNLASSAIAEGSSDNNTFTIDQKSIIFEIESGVVQRFCDSTPCVGANVVCISVVGGYHCSCSTGYSRINGICSRARISNETEAMQRYCNATGTMIPKQKICDNVQDCPDNSDEINCACNSTYQYPCRNGRCIYKEWLCDGEKDCPQGDDEIPPQCAECTSSEFRCEKPRKCISPYMRCDGRSDCVDSSDESRCVGFGGIGSADKIQQLTVTYRGTPGYRICSDGWNTTWNDWICTTMGFGSSTNYSSILSNGSFLTFNSGISSSNIMALLYPGTCSSQRAVALSCKLKGEMQNETQRYCNETGTLIPKQQICDKFQDCPDDSDEINCACNSTYQYPCRNGRCIYKEWLCDGVKDCPQGDDEIPPQCVECTSSKFRCEKPRKCISSNMRCDGRSDCVDSSDESRCVGFDGIGSADKTQQLTVTYGGTPGYRICSDGWNTTWNDWICTTMGFESVTNYSSIPSNVSFLTLNSGASSSNILALLNPGTCSSQRAVALSCKLAGCGTRSVDAASVGPYILNGHRAARGAWPWQVVVLTGYFSGGQFTPVFLCGGILIDRRWILTAAHCTQIDEYNSKIGYTGQTKPGNILVLLGTISLNDNPDMIIAYADQVHTHPRYDASETNNDAGLIRLSKPVSFSDTVRPICLPTPDQDLSRFKVCVNTGFGRTLRNNGSEDLLQAKMNVIPDSECQKLNRFYKNVTQICVGTTPTVGDINICNGDSGGPLSCQDPNGVWTAIGINSYGLGFGGADAPSSDSCRLSVVARVTAFVGWIKTTMSAHAI